MPKGQSLSERFWNRVRKTENCWEWVGARDSDGYGVLWTKERNNNERAHRISLILSGSEVPNNLMVLHSCDNPRCVNPDHLSVGDNRQNQIEARDRGLQGDLTKKRKDYIRSLSDSEFDQWRQKFKGKSGKSISNLKAAIKWRNTND